MRTSGHWRRRSIPGHLFEIHNDQGETVLKIRGGMMPTLEDARLLVAAPKMLAVLIDIESFLKRSGYDTTLVKAAIKSANSDEP